MNPNCLPPSSMTSTACGGCKRTRAAGNTQRVPDQRCRVSVLNCIDGVRLVEGVTMHTARWDHAGPDRQARVGIIGTGASAVRVIPDGANCLPPHRFQRTPIWCFPPNSTFHCPQPSAGACEIPRQSRPPAAQPGLREATFPIAAHLLRLVFPLAKHMESSGRRCITGPRSGGARATHPRYAVGCKRRTTTPIIVQPGTTRAAGHRADRPVHPLR